MAALRSHIPPPAHRHHHDHRRPDRTPARGDATRAPHAAGGGDRDAPHPAAALSGQEQPIHLAADLALAMEASVAGVGGPGPAAASGSADSTPAAAAGGAGRRETEASNLSEVDAGVTGGAGAHLAWLGAQALLFGAPQGHALPPHGGAQQGAVGAHAGWETVVTGPGWGQARPDQGVGARYMRYDTASSASTAQDRDSPQGGAALAISAGGERQGPTQHPAPALQGIAEEERDGGPPGTPSPSAAARVLPSPAPAPADAAALPPWMGATPRRGRLPPIASMLQAPASSPGATTGATAMLAPEAALAATRSTPGAAPPPRNSGGWAGAGPGGAPAPELQLTSRSAALLRDRAAALRADLEGRLGGAARLGEALEALRRAQGPRRARTSHGLGGEWPGDAEEEGGGSPVALSGLDASLLVRDLHRIVHGRAAAEGQAGGLAAVGEEEEEDGGITDLLPALDELVFLERRLGIAS